jgi:endonuclease/exonuclease/phosphatase family metal-dependent hydrolase
MPEIRIGTFNSENLFLRYRPILDEKTNRPKKAPDADTLNVNDFRRSIDKFGPIGPAERELTAKVILSHDADIVCVQEVENLEALDKFNLHYLKKRYPFLMVIDGNDPRNIDVGILSKFPFAGLRTHRFEPVGKPPSQRTFSRDCLAVLLQIDKTTELAVYVNHFKSKLPTIVNGKTTNGEARRLAQAKRVAEIIQEDFGKDLDGDFVVAGDLNMGPDEKEFRPLKKLVNTMERLPEPARWTHWFDRAKPPSRPQEQLDYLLLSPRLAARSPKPPIVERRGLPKKAVDGVNGAPGMFGGAIRAFPRPASQGTGNDKRPPEASDHCALFQDLVL